MNLLRRNICYIGNLSAYSIQCIFQSLNQKVLLICSEIRIFEMHMSFSNRRNIKQVESDFLNLRLLLLWNLILLLQGYYE